MNYRRLDEEHYVENPFLEHLRRLGWKVYRGNKLNPLVKEIKGFKRGFEPEYGDEVQLRKSFREVVLEDELKEALRRINPWLEDDQVEEAIIRIQNPPSRSLIEANMEIHNLLLEGISVSENRKTGEKSPTVRYIDFENPENNSFIAISQFKVNIPGTEGHIIPDIVLFVNGLPLVVVECKSPTIADPLDEAIKQLMRYSNRRGAKEGNEKLFWYNLFQIATFRRVAKYGTITSDKVHFVEWKDPYPYTVEDIQALLGNEHIYSQELLIRGMLSKENLLEILHTFTVFMETPKGFIKIVPRYQQFRTVQKIIKRLKSYESPEKRGGIVWHTQGSGKSLTMMFTIRALNHDPELTTFKVVLITDRRNLEKQLKETAKGVGYTVRVAQGVDHLKELLRTNTPDIVMAIVHKFQERDLEREFPVLNTSDKILIMVDEAHRSQYKLLGANMRKALPNATKIAFTGTPIDKTEVWFGEYIDKYTISQSVKDGVTVEILYEGRAHKAEISDEEAMNKRFEDVFGAVEVEKKKLILGKYTWQAYLEDEDVIRDKAKDMIDHYLKTIFPNGFKAQVVTVSRLAAIRYKHALEDALMEKIKELEENPPLKKQLGITDELFAMLKRLKVGVVISARQNDPQEWKEYTDPSKHREVIESFKTPFGEVSKSGIPGDVGIIVVKSMLITGFDAPIEQVMYLDTILKGHNLLQAIARVNRVYKNKSAGYVVDYVGITEHLEEALSIYRGEDIKEIKTSFYNREKSLDNLEVLSKKIDTFFLSHGISNWRSQFEDCIDLLEDEETRQEFLALVRKFGQELDRALPDPRAVKYARDWKILSFIRETAKNIYRDDSLSISEAANKIREIVEEFLISKGVDPKIPPTPLFSEEFEKQVKKWPPKLQAKEVESAIKEYILRHYPEDPELYERLAERLKRILEEYQGRWELLSRELLRFRRLVIRGRSEEENYGLDPKKEMPFLGVLKKELYGPLPLSELPEDDVKSMVSITKKAIDLIKQSVKVVDFWESPTKQRELRAKLLNEVIIPNVSKNPKLFKMRNKIVERWMELAYHHYSR
ncbi:restriction endonuclease subunit R [Thermococcus celericrescens]|uniref:type I site-specific deoxyribonuclease n=1 Tax=Thermococcus celericrescens TaxID=227598 RepID=A0A117ITH9_9EURY|nr:type I restriction endonuclease subunit R [Thermococcus celericrescens]KUH34001.1 restriction endonuclease subunit R [Thermococcus celericrescens]